MDDREKAAKITAGDVRTASRLIRNLEDRLPTAKTTLKHIFLHTGRAHVIGITGSPGAGKSTIADALIASYRKLGKTVGVLAVDPTSPFTGGAILGDRIRMQRHAEDPGVFIRSLATRGSLGGLSHAVGDAIHVLDAMGKDIILIETVGTGQQEVEIINHAHTVVVLLVPGMGDEIQAMKAGIMEIADIFVINKADREGARQLHGIISAMLDLAREFPGGWRPPILEVENFFEPVSFLDRIAILQESVDRHYQLMAGSELLEDRLKRKSILELNEALRAALIEPVMHDLVREGEFAGMISRIMKKEADPYSLAEEIAARYFKAKTAGKTQVARLA